MTQKDNSDPGAVHVNPVDRLGRRIDPAVLNVAEVISRRALRHAEKLLIDPAVAINLLEEAGNDQREIGHSLKAASVRRELEASLRRLQLDVVDLYQIHWPDPEPEIEEGWQTLAQLQKEGKVRYIGVSNFNVEQMKRVGRIAPITSLQPNYNIVTRDIEREVLPFCREQHIGVIVYSPMKSGLLSGKMTRERIASLPPDDFRPRTASFKEPLLSRNLGLVEVLRSIGERHGHTPGEVAIAWTLRDAVVTGAIVGMRSAEQARQIVRSAEFRLTADEVLEIEAYLNANPVGN